MTQSTYFNQVKNVLKVLQGYTKGIRFLLVMFVALTVSANVWGADVTYVFKDAADNPGNANDWLTDDIDSYTSWSATKGGNNNPKYYSTGNGLRVYNGGKFTITSSKTLASITLTFSGTGYTFQSTNTTTPQTVTPNAKSYEWSVGRTCRLQKIEITYAAGSSTPTPSLSATPTTIDFGTVEQGATIANKTVAINFANLTGQVNYSGLSNPFTATGTVSNSGDNITIAANTATIGEYSQTLTITSAADSKTAEVIVKMNIVAPFEGKKLVFDFVTHPSGWPAAKANATEGSYVYTLDEVDYTFSHTKSGDGIYLGGTSKTSGYLMLASGNKLGLPAIKGYKLVKVDGTLNGSGTPSTASQVSITNAGGTVISGGAAQTWDTKGGTKTYNLTDTEANTVYYLTVANKNLQMITLALYYEEVAGAVEIPSAPAFTVAGGSYYGTQSIEITCATAGANIYYTLDGSVPTSSSTPYTGAISISETKTLKAIAIKGENSSSVTEATYTILAPLATMQEIFDKATAVGGIATPVKVTMNNWVVIGAADKNVYVTDGTKGFIIYKNDGGHGFVPGDVLSGTVACKVQLYNGSSELTELTKTTEGLTVTTGGTITPVEVDDVNTLGGVNTGSVIKITGTCESGNVVAGVKLYGTLYTFDNLTVGNKYNVTGVYLQYGDVEEILPRSAEDIEEIQEPLTTYNVNWLVNGDELADSESVKEGTKITRLPEDPTDECGGKTFVGWSNQEVTDGNKPAVLFTDAANSPTIDDNTTFYAVFATASGEGFTIGQSGDFKIYANVEGSNIYAATYNNGKLTSTNEDISAVTFKFTHKENNQYTIYNGSKYVAYGTEGTDLKTQSDEYLWTIASATDGKGSWRVTSVNTPSRAIIYRSGYDFKAYGTNNINTNGYYDIEIGGAITYTEYVTSCVTCEDVLTISKGNEENGTFTLDKVGEQETCEGLSVLVAPTPAEHYHVASVSANAGEIVNNGDGTYTITYAANSTGESTINVVFEEDTKYTVTWMVNGLPYTIGTPSTTVYADERVTTLPTPPNPNAYCGQVFVGWTDAENGEYVHGTSNLYATPLDFPTASADQIFYAVFADYDQQ